MNHADDIWISFPGLPPSANRIWRTGRNGITFISKEYSDFKRFIRGLLRGTKIDYAADGVKVTMYLFPANNRPIDVDNRTKSMFDALTEAGVWYDDKCVNGVEVWRCGPVSGGFTIVRFNQCYRTEVNSIESLCGVPHEIAKDLVPYKTKQELKQSKRIKQNGKSKESKQDCKSKQNRKGKQTSEEAVVGNDPYITF